MFRVPDAGLIVAIPREHGIAVVARLRHVPAEERFEAWCAVCTVPAPSASGASPTDTWIPLKLTRSLVLPVDGIVSALWLHFRPDFVDVKEDAAREIVPDRDWLIPREFVPDGETFDLAMVVSGHEKVLTSWYLGIEEIARHRVEYPTFVLTAVLFRHV